MKNKYLTFLVLLLTFSVFVNCENGKYNAKDLYYLNFTDSLTLDVTKTAIHGKVFFLNDSVVLYKSSKLIYENYHPKWLFDKTEKKKYFYDYVYSPEIFEIEPPFKIIKTEKSDVFQVIKKTDTLLFYFETFDKVDLMFLY